VRGWATADDGGSVPVQRKPVPSYRPRPGNSPTLRPGRGEQSSCGQGPAGGIKSRVGARPIDGTRGAATGREDSLQQRSTWPKKGARRVRECATEAEDEEVGAGVAVSETTAEIAEGVPGRSPKAVQSRRVTLMKGEHPVAADEAAFRESLAERPFETVLRARNDRVRVRDSARSERRALVASGADIS
jgi:hypothetical protein